MRHLVCVGVWFVPGGSRASGNGWKIDGIGLIEEIRAKPGRLGEARAVKTLRVQGLQVFASKKIRGAILVLTGRAPDFDVYQPAAVWMYIRRNLSVSWAVV
jgi:hypothetical protein